MALSMLHPRRRGLLVRAFCLLTFVGFMSLWFMADSNGGKGSEDTGGRSAREAPPLNNHIDGNLGAGIEAPSGGGVLPPHQVVSREDKGDHSRDRILNHIENSVNNFNLNPQYPKKGEEDPLLLGVNPPALPVPGHPNELDRRRAEAMFAVDEAKVVPGLGENGKAVHLAGEELARAEEVIKVEAFNKILSDKISVNRTVPDSRDPLCKRLTYDSSLPSATVIIIFTNEAWTPLIRTVHSVLNMSPLQHLTEILLVDDFSDKEELGEKLDLYIKYRLPAGKVRMVRLPSRHGLIRARLAGAKEAKGDVLIFLDSHCEANTMWMEPLLQRIKESRSAVLVPIIDVIDDKTLEYYAGNGRYFQVGGFTWSGHFTWIEISEQEEKRRGSHVAPTRSPTMAGGLFAIDRNYFWEVGGYDEGMDVWGGENLEMSFRVWMCGGTLETLPCSRVGHIFRSFHPYTFPGNKDTHGLNTARLAEVWMDDYKRLFYMNRPELETADWGDVTQRRELRRQLQCHSFKWYLDNIFPEKFVLDQGSYAYGRVHNLGSNFCLDTLEQEDLDAEPYDLGLFECGGAPLRTQLRNNATTPNLCLDTLQAEEKKGFEMGLYNCHTFLAGSQYMSLSHAGELRREDVCAEVPQSYQLQTKATVHMTKCHGSKGSQEWVMTKSGHLLHKASNLCLDTANKIAMASVSVRECRATASQQWWFDHYSVG